MQPTSASQLLEQLLAGSIGPISKLQESLNLTLDQITRWIADPDTLKQIGSLTTLYDAQTQLTVCQHRLFAAARLVEVAATATAPETIRRACVDLLKLKVFDLSKVSGVSGAGAGGKAAVPNDAVMQPPDPLTSQMLQDAMNQVAKDNRASYMDDEPLPGDFAEDPDPRRGDDPPRNVDPPHYVHAPHDDERRRDDDDSSPPRHDGSVQESRANVNPAGIDDPYLFSQKGTEAEAEAEAEADSPSRGSMQAAASVTAEDSSPRDGFGKRGHSARAHYTSPTEKPRSDAAAKENLHARPRPRRPSGARANEDHRTSRAPEPDRPP